MKYVERLVSGIPLENTSLKSTTNFGTPVSDILTVTILPLWATEVDVTVPSSPVYMIVKSDDEGT